MLRFVNSNKTYMASINFPTDSELRKYIVDHMDHFTSSVKNAVGDLDETYFSSVKTRKKGWRVISVSLFIFFLSFPVIKPLPLLGFTLLTLAIICFAWGVKMVRVGSSKKIHAVISRAHNALLPVIAAAAGVTSITEVQQRKKEKSDFDTVYKKTDENMFQANNRLAKVALQLSTTYDYDELVEKLERSALLAEVHGKVTSLLMLPIIYTVETESKNLTFSQLLSRPFVANDAGQDLRIFTQKMSKSLFIEVPLQQTFSGTTIVTTEKFSGGTNQSLYIQSLRKMDLNVSELESNDFEDLLHVITDDEVEARYILTPDFMESVYLWWQEKKQDIRISFTGTTMNILIFGDQVAFGGNLADISEEEIAHHVEAMLIPLVHSMYLVNAYSESR